MEAVDLSGLANLVGSGAITPGQAQAILQLMGLPMHDGGANPVSLPTPSVGK